MRRYYNQLAKLYQKFSESKTIIFSALFIMSILRSVTWYALWGVDILNFSNLQDIFMSFANYTMILTISLILIIIFGFFRPQKNRKTYEKVLIYTLLAILYLISLWLFVSIFRMIFSIISLLSMICFIMLIIWGGNKCKPIAVFMVLSFPIIQPIEQYFNIKNVIFIENKVINNNSDAESKLKQKAIPAHSFREQKAHYDSFSFTYNEIVINTEDKRYYPIGNNSNYFFIVDCITKEVLIIHKSGCVDIKSKPFGIENLLFIKDIQ